MPLPYSREQFMRLIDSRRFPTEARLTELPTDFISTHDSVQQWICRIRDGATKHHDDTSLVHICRALNQCMIATHERKQSVSCIQRPTFILPWHLLCGDAFLLRGLLQLVLTGCGFPDVQESSAILLYNMCTIASRETRSSTVVHSIQVQSLTVLIDHVATPLSIMLTGLQLDRLLPWVSGSLLGLLRATEHCRHLLDPAYLDWPNQACLLTHLLMAIENTLPPLFTREFRTTDIAETFRRFEQMIREQDFNVAIFAALVRLLEPCLLSASEQDLAKEQNKSTLDMLFRFGLANSFLGISAYWPCEDCRTGEWGSTDWKEPPHPTSPCMRTWNDLDEGIMNASHELIRATFRLITEVPNCLTHAALRNDRLNFASLKFAACLVQCRSHTQPSRTTTCVINLLRIVGNCCVVKCHVDFTRIFQDAEILDVLRYLAVWLSYRVDWMYCAEEVCWLLANTVTSMSLSILQPKRWKITYDLFVSRCLLRSLTNDSCSSQAVRLLHNSVCFEQFEVISAWISSLNCVDLGISNRIGLWRLRGHQNLSSEDNLYIIRLFWLISTTKRLEQSCLLAHIQNHCKYLSVFLHLPWIPPTTGSDHVYSEAIPSNEVVDLLLSIQ